MIRMPYAGGIGGVEHHCDSSEAYYAHTPGPHVVAPATAATPTRCCARRSTSRPGHLPRAQEAVLVAKDEVDLTAQAPADRPRRRAPRGHRRDADRLRTDGAGRARGRRGRRARGPEPRRSSTCARSCRSTTRPCARRCARRGAPSSSPRRRVRRAWRPRSSRASPSGASTTSPRPSRRVTGFDIPFPPPKLEHFHLPVVDRDPRRGRRAAVGRPS